MEENSPYFSLPDYISGRISKDILLGKHKAGDKLVEAMFQEEFQVSKSPVREAFQMLINAGLVERKNRRGCFVKVLTSEEIENIYEVRMSLEGLAARDAYMRMSDGDLKRLQGLYHAMEKDVAAKDTFGYLHHHNDFQRFFGEVSRNGVLVEICEKLRVQNMWYNMQFFEVDLEVDLHTHDELMDHFTKRDLDPDQVQLLMYNHVRVGLENFRAYIRNEGTLKA
ncbi:MAG: hypothetical protein CVV48_06930 [Spirochaetae bacterium HGW-Spirochaetae-4]|jgi:DNA-binding GntR family transcriptional regulator|nr:MAG: hypothetical protein CVV53_09460 [Spirochaetae bacterium HGW-Spirochaetae-9]PKL21606.1 MAG: hypothetical protein CVV48_06930 [Spirochaetae bacterium HGW-Spirochaetae-4]HCS35691.1 hypothetical protein [Sphaerochaeta sp.]